MADNYLRVCRLIAGGKTYDLDDMQIEFLVRQKRIQTPATAEIRVLNLADTTKNAICVQNQLVILEAGYRDHYWAIFKGTIKQGQPRQDQRHRHVHGPVLRRRRPGLREGPGDQDAREGLDPPRRG